MLDPMTRRQRKSACMALAAFAMAIVSLSLAMIPSMVAITWFLFGTVFWWKAMFSK